MTINSLPPDNHCKQIQIRADKTSGLIWIESIWHSDAIPERIFRKNWFWKKSAVDKKKQNYPVGKELKLISSI